LINTFQDNISKLENLTKQLAINNLRKYTGFLFVFKAQHVAGYAAILISASVQPKGKSRSESLYTLAPKPAYQLYTH
jgi:hypothetical protein